MKNRKIKKLLSRVLVAGILAASLTGNSVIAYAASSEESDQNIQENSDSEETKLKENSWRYENGEPIKNNRASRAATYPYAWEKVDGQYVNDRGEVIPGAQKKGIDIGEAEIEKQERVVKSLPPENKPSTLQDLERGRKTEVEMFSGTVIRLGEELGIDTPVNRVLYHGIKVLEYKNGLKKQR